MEACPAQAGNLLEQKVATFELRTHLLAPTVGRILLNTGIKIGLIFNRN